MNLLEIVLIFGVLIAAIVLLANELRVFIPQRRSMRVQPGGIATGGKAAAGMAYRSYEGDVAAVDTLTNLAAFGGNAQTVQVPQGAKVLDRIDIDMSLDLGAAVVSVRGHCQIRIIGQGIKGSPHDFGGPAMSCQGVTSGNAIAQGTKKYENLGIPVVSGGDLQIQAALIGEDPGDATIAVSLGYILG
jgi:hypothetical protein